MVMGQAMSNIWRYYVINFIEDQDNLNKTVSITNLYTIFYLLNYENNDRKKRQPESAVDECCW